MFCMLKFNHSRSPLTLTKKGCMPSAPERNVKKDLPLDSDHAVSPRDRQDVTYGQKLLFLHRIRLMAIRILLSPFLPLTHESGICIFSPKLLPKASFFAEVFSLASSSATMGYALKSCKKAKHADERVCFDRDDRGCGISCATLFGDGTRSE